MKHNTDLDDYTELFEANQERRGIPKKIWAVNYLSNLNDKYREVAMKLTGADRDDYDKLKATLQAARECSPRELPKTFWEYTPAKDASDQVIAGKIEGYLTRMEANTSRSLRDQIAVEKYLTLLSPEKAEFIRRQTPDTLQQAVDQGILYSSTAVSKEESYSHNKGKEWHRTYRGKYRSHWRPNYASNNSKQERKQPDNASKNNSTTSGEASKQPP
jgi:hypothetical protein